MVLKNSLMQFREECFQKIFEVIMGKNVSPILANLYMAKLEKFLSEKCSYGTKVAFINFQRMQISKLWDIGYQHFSEGAEQIYLHTSKILSQEAHDSKLCTQ